MTVRTLTLSDAATAYGGTLMYPDCDFQSVSTDTRALRRGELFVALSGERFDAHQFLDSAARQACGLVVARADKNLRIPQWVVPDTVLALGQLAALARNQFSGPVIAVTGSSGKTTVKEMLAAILRGTGPVLATRGNLNNHIGVPLTLLGLQSDHKSAVVEMGASAAGEIAYLCGLARPSVAVVTNVLPAHVEGFGSLAGVASAKGEIYSGLDAGGTAVLNLDEPWLDQWRGQLSCLNSVTFSMSQQAADFTAIDVKLDAAGCPAFTLVTPQGSVAVQLRIPGRHNIANGLAAAACALSAGANLEQIAEGLRAELSASGRMQVRREPGGARIIDDTYNANPGSVKAAIDTLNSFPGKRVLVLGDMAELGADRELLHREVGRYAAEHDIDLLLSCGPLSALAAREFESICGPETACSFDDKRALAEKLRSVLGASGECTVLVKGSRSASMEDVIKHLREESLCCSG